MAVAGKLYMWGMAAIFPSKYANQQATANETSEFAYPWCVLSTTL